MLFRILKNDTLTLFLDKNFSLLCSTLRCYFEGRKELFEGLKIMYLEHEWVKRPVIYLSTWSIQRFAFVASKKKVTCLALEFSKESRGLKDWEVVE